MGSMNSAVRLGSVSSFLPGGPVMSIVYGYILVGMLNTDAAPGSQSFPPTLPSKNLMGRSLWAERSPVPSVIYFRDFGSCRMSRIFFRSITSFGLLPLRSSHCVKSFNRTS
jgi:hypothetical protein